MLYKKSLLFISIFFILISASSIAISQESQSKTNFSNILEEAREEVEREIVNENSEIVKARNNYILWNYWHFKWVYNWNFISTIIIFIVVHMMVLAGLYFSYLQFKHSLSITKIIDKEEKETKENTRASIPESKISLAVNKVEITSSVIGLIILTLSFAFFYLYIVYVYPVSVDNNTLSIDNELVDGNQIEQNLLDSP